jgi:YD repeat-containing protein
MNFQPKSMTMRNLISPLGLALVGLGITGLTAQAQFTLSSTVTYAGRQTGEVMVAPSANGTTLILARRISLGALLNQPFTNAAFALANLDDGATYHLFAWRDSISNGVPDATEAQAWHPDNPFLMTSNRTVAGFTLTDPDSDSDGRPDWWEMKYGLHDRIGSGRSGALLVLGTNFTDSVRASVVGSNPAGLSSLNVSAISGFASNDLVMIITMQDTNLVQNGAGTYEFGRVATLTQGGGITNLVLAAPRTNAFTPGAAQKIQVLKVPEYTEVTLAGSALRFDGTNDYVLTPDLWLAFGNDTTVTLEAWFNAAGPGVIIDERGDGASVGWMNSQLEVVTTPTNSAVGFVRARVWPRTSPGITLGIVSYGTWNHAVLRYSQSARTLDGLLNGVLSTNRQTYLVRQAPWQFGNGLFYGIGLGDVTHLGSGSFFRGQIADVRVWRTARTDGEVAEAWKRRLAGNEPGLVAYYPMDEGSGLTAADSTLNHRRVPVDGTLSGPAWVPGRIGQALSFAGDDDYLALPGGVYFNGNFTIEAWVYPRAFTLWGRVLDFANASQGVNQSVLLTFSDNAGQGNPHLRIAGSTLTLSGSPIRLNQWTHLAVTLNGTSAVIYTNGVAAGSGTVSVPVNVVRSDNKIAAPNAAEPNANVLLDELRIWSVARTQAEIAGSMAQTLTGQETGLVANWSFNEGAGHLARDATANHADGVLTGGPTWAAPSTLTCQPWNGTNGGVLAFLAHQVTLGSNSVISADGKGYRGGDGVPADGGDYAYGKAGARATGFSSLRESNSLERPPGGGGAGKGADGSGGGGGYASSGTDGSMTLSASDFGRGAAMFYGSADLLRIYPGGGGGGSGSHTSSRVGVAGGGGGGIVHVSAGWIRGSGTLSSCGAAGQDGVRYTTDAYQGSGGGGGAGGSVHLAGNFATSMQVLATGGGGGARHPLASSSKDGGAGGVGRIRLDLPPGAVAPTLNPAVGYVQPLPATNTLVWKPYEDTDQDGLSDLSEYELDTNPVSADTDGDGLPDGWEVAYGLDPRVPNNAWADVDGDGVPDYIEFQRSTRPDRADTDGDGLSDYQELFVRHTDPLRDDTDGDGISDAAEVAAGSDPLFAGTQYFYDAIDRLVGVQHENGLALGYEYDRNNNLVRQFYAQRDGNGNVLPDLWEFLNGLTNQPSAFTDSDFDGWSDYQEWQAGTNPLDPNNQPDVVGNAGTKVASMTWPFTPSNFVVGAGQLDGLGAEEIVIGADGNPGGAINFLLVLSQTTNATWSTQRVDVGSYGVTSIAVGQPSNRPNAAIYVGLRQTGGLGKLAEFVSTGGQWISSTIANSAHDAAFVLGVRAGQDVVASQAGTNGPPGSAYSLGFTATDGWKATLGYTTPSQRGLGTIIPPGLSGVPSFDLRLLDAGGIQTARYFVPTNAVWNATAGRWFFLTPTQMTWDDAQAYARQLGGNLATVNDSVLNAWAIGKYLSAAGANGFWIGLSRPNCASPWQWASGAPVSFLNWLPGQPDCYLNNESVVHIASASGWNDNNRAYLAYGLVEVPGEPPGAAWNEDYARLFFPTPRALTWDNAQAYARQMGGNLATVNSPSLNSWLINNYLTGAGPTGFWIGLSRQNCASAWQWASGTAVSFSDWRAGEPNGCPAGTEFVVHIWNTPGTTGWNDTSRSFTATGVVEISGTQPSYLAGEPPASRRLLWRGHSLNAGTLRLNNAVSILYAFVDDMNLSGAMDAGDDFVVTEYLYNGAGVVTNPPHRTPLSGSPLASSYGLASVDVLFGNQQVFFTAEPDGRVFSWTAPGATTPLQRQLFSAQHAGQAWHALAGVKALASGQSLLGLRVDPAAASRCDVILWPPQGQLWSPTEVPQTAPITQILPTPNQGRDLARVDVRLWDAEGNAATPSLQYRLTNSPAWSNATIAAINGAALGAVAASPTGQTHQVSWNAGLDLGSGFTNSVRLRARAQDVTLTGEWSAEVAYLVRNSATLPAAQDDATNTFQGTWVDIAVLANDTVTAPPKRIYSVGQPAHGTTATNLNATIRYTPAPGFTGTDSFVYTLADGASALSSATATVTVLPTGPVIMLESPALLGGNQFSLLIRGRAAEVYQMQVSTNLASWANLALVTNVTGVVPFTTPLPPNTPRRFYRALLKP